MKDFFSKNLHQERLTSKLTYLENRSQFPNVQQRAKFQLFHLFSIIGDLWWPMVTSDDLKTIFILCYQNTHPKSVIFLYNLDSFNEDRNLTNLFEFLTSGDPAVTSLRYIVSKIYKKKLEIWPKVTANFKSDLKWLASWLNLWFPIKIK